MGWFDWIPNPIKAVANPFWAAGETAYNTVSDTLKPELPPLPPAAQLPGVEDPAVKASAERERKAALLRKGRYSTILTSGMDLGAAPVQQKTLLGQ